MNVRAMTFAVMFLAAAAAQGQIRPIFDPDDFLDPGERTSPIFITRLVAGVVRSPIDDFRPVHQDIRVLHLANGFYWSKFEIDYKHSEQRGENTNAPAHVQVCPCRPPVYFPTPPPDGATPDPPLPSRKDAMQFAWYHTSQSFMLRYRVSFSRQDVDTVATFTGTDHVASRLHGREQSAGLEADTYFRIGSHDLFGSLLVAHTERKGTADDRSQNELTYVNRFPGRTFGKVLLHATLTVGGVTGRGASGINVVNPAFEAFWHDWTTDVNVHFIVSPVAMRSRLEGWKTHTQIAILIDRALILYRRQSK